MGQADRARECYEAALGLYRKERDGLGEANTLWSLGDLEIRFGQIDRARSLYELALGLFRNEQEGLGEANTLKSMGDLERHLGQVDLARECYEAALSLSRKMQDVLGEANTLHCVFLDSHPTPPPEPACMVVNGSSNTLNDHENPASLPDHPFPGLARVRRYGPIPLHMDHPRPGEQLLPWTGGVGRRQWPHPAGISIECS